MSICFQTEPFTQILHDTLCAQILCGLLCIVVYCELNCDIWLLERAISLGKNTVLSLGVQDLAMYKNML